MKFNSKVHGEISYTEEDKVKLNYSLLGFDGLKEFVLIDLKEYEPFKLFQSLENEEVGFIVISPFDFFEEYEFDISDEIIEELSIERIEEVLIITTVTLNSDPKKITTNLKGPILINTKNRLGKQIILDMNKYDIKHPLTKE